MAHLPESAPLLSPSGSASRVHATSSMARLGLASLRLHRGDSLAHLTYDGGSSAVLPAGISISSISGSSSSSSAGDGVSKAAPPSDLFAWLSSLPALPPSAVPRSAPLSRARARLYSALSEASTSLLGVAAAALNVAAVLATLIAFTIASLPESRLRAARGVSGTPEVAMEAVNAAAAAVFIALLAARVVCVTAVPDLHEARALRRVAAADGEFDCAPTAPTPPPPPPLDAAAAALGEADDAEAPLDLDGTLMLRLFGAPGGAPPLLGDGWPAAWRAPLCGGALRRRNAPRLLRWAANAYNLIDALSIVPFIGELLYAGAGTGDELLRLLRFMCLLRLVRLASDTVALRLLRRAVLSTLDSLRGALWLLALTVALLAAAIFVAEKGDYDAGSGQFRRANIAADGLEDSPFRSVPQACYWVVATITSTGYGDLVPTSVAGKLIAALTMALGVFLLAVPATLIGFSFSYEYDAYRLRVAARARALRAAREAAAAAAAAAAAGDEGAAGVCAAPGVAPLGATPPDKARASASAAAGAGEDSRVEELARALEAVQRELRGMRAAVEGLASALAPAALPKPP